MRLKENDCFYVMSTPKSKESGEGRGTGSANNSRALKCSTSVSDQTRPIAPASGACSGELGPRSLLAMACRLGPDCFRMGDSPGAQRLQISTDEYQGGTYVLGTPRGKAGIMVFECLGELPPRCLPITSVSCPDSFKCRANRSWTRMCTIDAVSSFPFCPWNTSLRPAQAITVPSCSSIADWTKRVENKPIIAFHPSRRDPLIAEGRRHWLLS